MPRKSAEERAAAAWRARKPPSPPKTLSRAARATWREIVKSRPPDFFPTSILPLLEAFCVAAGAVRNLSPAVEADPADREAADAWQSYAKVMVSLATKLRLVNTAKRDSGIHSEGGGGDHPLIGGSA